MRKAQSGLEFMLVTIVALSTLIVILVILYMTTSMKQDEQVLIEAERVSLALRNELIFASEAETGYFRIFELPLEIRGYDYVIDINQTNINTSYLELKIKDSIFYQSIPLTVGEIVPGDIIIFKNDSVIEVEGVN